MEGHCARCGESLIREEMEDTEYMEDCESLLGERVCFECFSEFAQEETFSNLSRSRRKTGDATIENPIRLSHFGATIVVLVLSMLWLVPVPVEAADRDFAMQSPPIAGIGGRYLGVDQVVRDDRKTALTILCKSGYDSVLVFPGRKVLKVFVGGYSWAGSVTKTKGESLVILNPPATLPVSTNLVVVFDRGESVFRLKVVDPDKPFMARTVILGSSEFRGQRLK